MPRTASILLVDDREENLMALQAILQRDDYRLLVATSGEEALKVALREQLTVILLDVVMPGIDGFEVARHLKTLERTREIPILFLTGLATDVKEIYRAYEAGAVDYLVKPLDSEVVRRKVQVFVDLANQKEDLRDAERRDYEVQLAARSAKAREELLAIVSHDLRNPLGAIVTAAGGLARNAETADPARIKRAADLILRSAERMERLIGDLLDFAKLEGGQLSVEKKPVSAEEIVEDCVELFTPIASEKGLRLAAESAPDIVVNCDRERILQVIANLMSNAIKFTEKGTISLTVKSTDRGVVFTIGDTGPGIPADQLEHIWERYWQAGAKKRGGGIGLGLFIAKGLVEANGGRIWAESEVGVGTKFHFTLQRAVGTA
jgi:signal transduction histidine kinase